MSHRVAIRLPSRPEPRAPADAQWSRAVAWTERRQALADAPPVVWPGTFSERRRRKADVPVIGLQGELDPAAVIRLHCRIGDALDAGHRDLVLDLGAVELLGTPTLSLLCGAARAIDRRGATLAIVGLSGYHQRALEDCGIDGIEHHPTVEAALRSVRPSSHTATVTELDIVDRIGAGSGELSPIFPQ